MHELASLIDSRRAHTPQAPSFGRIAGSIMSDLVRGCARPRAAAAPASRGAIRHQWTAGDIECGVHAGAFRAAHSDKTCPA